MNPQAERITGWREEAARGRSLSEVLPVVDLDTGEPLPDPAARVLAARRPLEAIHRGLLVAPDGREVLIEDSGAPITRADGTISGVVLVFRDVTAKAELEDRLRHSQKMEAVGQLAGGVAHDFNNMLMGIMGYAEMVRRARDVRRGRGRLLRPHPDRRDRAPANLTRKLLAFSRKGKVLSTPVDAHDLIREAVALLERSVDRRIDLRTDLAAGNASVVGDPTQIQQAVLNLGLNARDAMPEGGTLTIATCDRYLDRAACDRVRASLVPGDYLEITVRDTGVGIPADVLPRIFEPFYTTKPVGEGTGLGLAAVRGTVEEHLGAVTVDSTVGAGTEFRVLLPLSGLPAQAPLIEDAPPAIDAGTVLVVDDESVIRGMVRRLLEGMGWTVLLAADGQRGPGALPPRARAHRRGADGHGHAPHERTRLLPRHPGTGSRGEGHPGLGLHRRPRRGRPHGRGPGRLPQEALPPGRAAAGPGPDRRRARRPGLTGAASPGPAYGGPPAAPGL